MRCSNCGADIPNREVRCGFCGHSVQMVPDYNPLDEVVVSEIRSSIPERKENATRRENVARKENAVRSENSARDAAIKKRKQAERNRALKKKKRNYAIVVAVFLLIMTCGLAFYIQYNSYSSLINRGDQAMVENNRIEAITLYEKALNKKPHKTQAYLSIYDVYYEEEDFDASEEILLEGISENPNNIDLYLAIIQFYQLIGQEDKIMEIYTNCSDEDVKDAISLYNSEAPVFSLEGGSFDDVQELTLTSSGEVIYYTEDGTEPTKESLEYEGAIQLKEGTTTITAISYNSEGVPSDIVSDEYTIELPIEGAPVVNPSTGQYKEATQISVTVPQGYEAYYTVDGSSPTAESTKYEGPIDMPEGNTIFSAILINTSGKSSDITKRNYSLVIEEEEEETY